MAWNRLWQRGGHRGQSSLAGLPQHFLWEATEGARCGSGHSAQKSIHLSLELLFKWHFVRLVPSSVSAGAVTAQKYLTSLVLDYLTESTIVLLDLKWCRDVSHTEAPDSVPHH